MDLNHLLYQHQAALLRSGGPARASAPSPCDLVQHYQVRIARLRQALGVSPYPDWCSAPQVGAA